MQRCSTGCKLLLITSAVTILLQLSLSLYFHQLRTHHDRNDSLHSFPEPLLSDYSAQDTFLCLTALLLSFIPVHFWSRASDGSSLPLSSPVVGPHRGRAPPGRYGTSC